MKLVLTTVIAVAAFVAAQALAGPARPEHLSSASPKLREHVTVPEVTATAILAARGATWSCQRKAGLEPSRAELGAQALAGMGLGFRSWTIARWESRLAACRDVLARTLPVTNDWVTATGIAEKLWPGSARWLLDCSSSEGGHGAWVWRGGTPARFDAAGVPTNYPGDVPGGPMQYMEGTFWGDYNAAVLDLRGRGIRVPSSSATWFSMLGQALAGGWASGHNRPSGKWTGYRC